MLYKVLEVCLALMMRLQRSVCCVVVAFRYGLAFYMNTYRLLQLR